MCRVLFYLPWGDTWVPCVAYGTLLLAGFVLGTAVAVLWARVRGIRAVHIIDTALAIAISSVVGARAWYVVEYWQADFAGRPWSRVFEFQAGGLVFYGGYVLAAVVAISLIRLRGLDWRQVTDILTPSVALGGALTRVGCFCNGCCFGQGCPADHPLAVSFPRGCACFAHQLAAGDIPADAAHTTPVYATQLLEAGGFLLLFVVLTVLLWRRPERLRGVVFLAFLLLYPILRFIGECYRVSPRGPLRLSSAQFVSMGIFAAAAAVAVGWWLRARGLRPASDSTDAAEVRQPATAAPFPVSFHP
jgi:phosphatidylglycerol:prolipoprotein diacylglycerol transferase